MEENNSKEEISMELDPIKLENAYVNPWTTVEDLSEFLNYCCPECDYKDKNEQSFSYHALQTHKNATIFFASNKEKLTIGKIGTKSKMESNIDVLHEYEDNHDNYFAPEPDNVFDDDWKEVKIKTEFDELENDEEDHDIKSESETKPLKVKKKKIKSKSKSKTKKISKESKVEKLINLTCELCWMEFSSAKVMNSHNKEKHLSKDSKRLKCCLYCDHKTKQWGNLKIHIEAKHPEHGEKKHICDKCSEGYIFSESLSAHKYNVHSNFVCEMCGMSYTNRGNYNEHMINKHNAKGANTFVCDQCGYSTPSKVRLNKHVYEKHALERHHQCPYCPYKNHALFRLNIHIDSVHPDNEEKKFFCNHCPKSFIYRDSMKKHMDTVKEKSEYQQKLNINCDYCKEVFDSTSSIKNHYKNVHPNKPMILPGHIRYNCNKCEAFYFTDFALKDHSKRIHASDSKRGPKKQLLSVHCDYCNEVLNTSFSIKVHYKNLHPGQLVITEGHEKYECTKCPDFFFLKQELDAHLNLEHGVKTDKEYCKICKVAFRNTHNCKYIATMQKQQEEKKKKKFPCRQCARKFTTSEHLRDHINTVHENRLDYGCEHCGKKLVSARRLTYHIKQAHSSQVTCEICNKNIANPAQLKRHKVFTHKQTDGAWFCQRCPKSVFFSKSTYENHLKDKH